MKNLRSILGALVMVCLAAIPFSAGAVSPISSGGSIFPLTFITLPLNNSVDEFNQWLILANAQVAPVVGPAPLACGATCTLASGTNAVVLLNTAAGSVLTLPAATGSGAKVRVIVTVTTTSAAHKVLAASVSDFMVGISYGFTGSTAKVFASAGATNHSLQMPFAGTQPSGGFIGDWFELTDVGANLWEVSGYYQAGTTPTTPYSSATS